MTRLIVFALLLIAPETALPETVITTRTLSANTMITVSDIELSEKTADGAFTSIDNVVGKVTRVILYSGNPVMIGSLSERVAVRRNEIVTFTYRRNGMTIESTARALDEGSLDEKIRVMNTDSRKIMIAVVEGNGIVRARASVHDDQ